MCDSFSFASFVRYRSQRALDDKISDISFQINKIADRGVAASRSFDVNRRDFRARNEEVSFACSVSQKTQQKRDTTHLYTGAIFDVCTHLIPN